ncbi:MAG: FAD-dependent oxidoreductase [Bacteroidota bacterium]|nr:FAD-dependent oxidoreductase [Bacteroidota bacterium]
MLSFWEINTFGQYDVAIIGSGITGMSLACSLKEKDSNLKIVIIERGTFPTGASTKNAGFACFGSACEILSDIKLMGEEQAIALVQKRVIGLQMLRTRLGDDKLGYLGQGGGELLFKNEIVEQVELDYLNKLLYNIHHKEVFKFDEKKIDTFGFNKNQLSAYIDNSCEGQIDTGLAMHNLWRYTLSLGIDILNGANVNELNDKNNEVHITIDLQPSSRYILKAAKVAVCTNAFTGHFFPELDIAPGRGQILVTKPIPKLKFKGIFHFDDGYFYFRDYHNRIIFGGGRNMDFETETTTNIALNEDIQQRLSYYLKELILHNQAFEIEHRWAGIMAFGKDKTPIVKKINQNIFAACRLNGMGIAIGSLIGEELAVMING